MKKTTFSEFWGNGLSRRLMGVVTSMQLSSADEHFYENTKRDLYGEYERLNKEFKTAFPIYFIDRHKIAALFCVAILRLQPVPAHQITTTSENISKLPNETFAFESALFIIWSFVKKDLMEQANIPVPNIDNHRFVFPKASDKPYQEHFFVMLYQLASNRGMALNHIDVLVISNIFFLLQQFLSPVDSTLTAIRSKVQQSKLMDMIPR